jgi:hypothetical protein
MELEKGGFIMKLFRLVYWTKDNQAISFVNEKNKSRLKMPSGRLMWLMKEDVCQVDLSY